MDRSLEFVRWPDDDDEWHLVIRASDGAYRVEQEFYTPQSKLIELADRLHSFPTHRADEVLLEVGSKDSGWAHWVILRAFIADGSGHAAITIDVGSNGAELYRRSAKFTIQCDVASINSLGEQLGRWLNEPSTPLRQQLHSS